MAFKDCIEEIKKASGDLFDDKTASELLKRIEQKKRVRKNKEVFENADEALLKETMEEIISKRTQNLISRREAIINETLMNKHYEGSMNIKNGNPVEYVTKLFKKVDSEGKGTFEGFLRILNSELDRENLKEEFWNREHVDDIAKEIYQINSKDGNPGVTGNPSAIKIAKIMSQLQEYTRARKNRAGAYIANLDGYITNQSWDSELIRNAGEEVWKQRMLQELDIDKTFKGIEANEIDEILKESYKGLVTGQHRKITSDGDFLSGYRGPGNLGKKLSQHRLFHFKDSDSWMRINNEFGTHSLHGSFLNNLHRSARSISMLENLGTNPENMYEALSSKVKREYVGDPAKVKSINGSKNTAMFKSLTGELSNPENMTLYKISDGLLKWNMITKLGSATISAITDLPTKISELSNHGINPMEAYWQTLKDTFRAFGKDKEMAEYFLAGLEGYQSQFANKLISEDLGVGKMSELTQQFFRLNLLEQWTDNHKAGFTHMLSNNLGQNATKSLSELSPKLRNMLELYEISDKDWDLLRNTVHTSESGTRYILTDKIDDISDSSIKSTIGELSSTDIERYKDSLKTKLQRYYSNSSDYAVITPDIEDRYYHTLGTKRGTLLGEAVRQVMQFKSFPFAVTKRMWERSGQVGDVGRIGLASTVAHMTLMGYVAMSIKDMLKGKKPRDPKDINTIFAALAQGGGFGIYGDFLFGQYSRFGQSPLATLGGPTIGTFSDLVTMGSQLVRGKVQDAQRTGIQTLKGNIPMINLFYTRTALDYLIFNNLQEMTSPGYISRIEQRTINNNQEYWLPPSRVISPSYDGESPLNFPGRVLESTGKLLGGQQ